MLTLITGLSGAGKSTAARALEDKGFYCIDNLPAALVPALLERTRRGAPGGEAGLALVMDGRDPGFVPALDSILAAMDDAGMKPEVIFLEADDETLLRRFSETRRRHPFADGGPVRGGIARERALMAPARDRADNIIDTSRLSPHDLKERMRRLPSPGGPPPRVNIMSFGFKHGAPPEADMILDVRFLPNPYFVSALRSRTGRDPEVASYVLDTDSGRRFIARLAPLLDFLVPQYRAEGKEHLTIAIGCTGGKHRSVAVCEKIAAGLRGGGRRVTVTHRDMEAE